MVVALLRIALRDPGLLQKVGDDAGGSDIIVGVKTEHHPFAEARRVGIPLGLSVTEGLQYRARSDDAVSDAFTAGASCRRGCRRGATVGDIR